MRLGDLAYAAQMRDFIRSEVAKQIDKLRPPVREAVVVTLDPTNYQATVRFLDEPDGDAIPVRMSGVQPVSVGQVVRIEGPRGDRFISAVYGETSVSGGFGTTEIEEMIYLGYLLSGAGVPLLRRMPPSWIGHTVEFGVAIGFGHDDTGLLVHYNGTIEDPENPGEYITPPDEYLPWLPDSALTLSFAAVFANEGIPIPLDELATNPELYTRTVEINMNGREMSTMVYFNFGPFEVTADYMAIFAVPPDEGFGANFPEPTYPEAGPEFANLPTPLGLVRYRLVG